MNPAPNRAGRNLPRNRNETMSFYITTPIFYVNAQPHLGHAYTTIVADVVSRFKRLSGEKVRFQTGTDEHGDKIAEAAGKAGETPQQYVDRISGLFREAWPPLTINPDRFIRTTDKAHIRTVQEILQKVYDQGDIYFSEYSGLYCKGCERFLTEKELVEGNCPDHLTPPAPITEQNYFFRMSKYQTWLIDHIQANPGFITPERYRNEVLSFLKEPLEDLCISRPTSRLTWGIPLPFDENFVTYVWFDALINYLTGLGYPDGPDFAEFWPVAEHVIAKDILKPHAIYWPTMLRALGLPPFRRLHVHGYWNINDTKMSKSLGNVVRPDELVERFGADTTRYFLLREMTFGLDSSFSYEALLTRQNTDLANDLGNLFSRSLTMVRNFCDSRVPHPGPLAAADIEMRDDALGMLVEYTREMNDFAFSRALQAVWKTISQSNKYIVGNAPWELAKQPDQGERLATVLHTLLETLRLIALTMQPVMPETADKMRTALGLNATPNLNTQGQWGLLEPGSEIIPGPPLFPRMDLKKPSQPTAPPAPKKTKKSGGAREQHAPEEGLITFEQFREVDLRVAEIVAAEKVAKSDRLLKLTVKAPEERTIVAGIAEYYNPADLVGRQVIIVANLKPAKLMGITSQGMVLAAKDGERLIVSGPSGPVSPGSKIA